MSPTKIHASPFYEMHELSKDPRHSPCGFSLVFFKKKPFLLGLLGFGWLYAHANHNHRDNFVIALYHTALGLHGFVFLCHKVKTLSSSWRCFSNLFLQSCLLKLFFFTRLLTPILPRIANFCLLIPHYSFFHAVPFYLP